MKLTHILTAAAAAGCALLLAACQPGGSDAPADYPVHLAGTVIDQRPERVVSLAPAITDMLYQLQIPGQLVAVSDYCELPTPTGREVAYDYPRAGTQQLPDLDTIVELDADLVLMTAEPTEDTANALLQADIDYLVLSPAADMDGVRENFVTLCKALYGDTTGAELASRRLTGYDHKYQRILDCLEDAAAAGEGAQHRLPGGGTSCRWPPGTALRGICSPSSAPTTGGTSTQTTASPPNGRSN